MSIAKRIILGTDSDTLAEVQTMVQRPNCSRDGCDPIPRARVARGHQGDRRQRSHGVCFANKDRIEQAIKRADSKATVHGSYERILGDPAIGTVTVGTPDHAEAEHDRGSRDSGNDICGAREESGARAEREG